jgi:hypothetical protein
MTIIQSDQMLIPVGESVEKCGILKIFRIFVETYAWKMSFLS